MTGPRTEPRLLDVARDGHVATVTLAGPDGRCTMDEAFFLGLGATFRALDADEEVRAVVVTGNQGNFSYGLDLKATAGTFGPMMGRTDAGPRVEFLRQIREWQATVDAVAKCRKPTIAAVTGWCIGGGVDIAAACDVRVCSQDAVFSVREAKMAIVADLGSLQRLVGIIGDGHLRELALTAEDFDAARAERIGLVNAVHPDADATLAAAREIAARMAANSPLVLQGVKDVLDAERGPRVEAGLRYTAVWNSAFLMSEDFQEAMMSFMEKRAPDYKGR
jgi:enoyl-CoA hydratase